MLTAYLRKYLVFGSQDCHREPEVILHEAIEAGITAFQYREKGNNCLQGQEKIQLGKKLRQICSEYDIPFIINDDVELIESLNVDGIHVGQTDTSVTLLREQYPNLKIGLSISTMKELNNSLIDDVDYIGAGPIFATRSKNDAKPVVGVNWINQLRKLHPTLPIIGIGGINEHNAKDVLLAGADGVAVISAITKANNITHVVNNL